MKMCNFSLIFFLTFFSINCIGQSMMSGDNFELSIHISANGTTFKEANDSVKLLSIIYNNSMHDIEILGPIRIIDKFPEYSDPLINSVFYVYDLEWYDDKSKQWANINDSGLFYDQMVVAFNGDVRWTKWQKIISKGSYRQELNLLDDLILPYGGKYKIQLILGIENEKRSFTKYYSNKIEFELVESKTNRK